MYTEIHLLYRNTSTMPDSICTRTVAWCRKDTGALTFASCSPHIYYWLLRVAVRDRDPRGGLAGKHSLKSVVNIGGKILFYLVLYGLSGKHSLKSAPSYICLSKSNLNSLLRTFSQPNVLRLVRALVDTPGRNSHQSEILNSQNLKFPQLRFFCCFCQALGCLRGSCS